jgi:hypothetical protein
VDGDEIVGRALGDVGGDFEADRKKILRAVQKVTDANDHFRGSSAGSDVPEDVERELTKAYKAVVNYTKITVREKSYFEHFDEDDVFARARVAGVNPMALRAVKTEDMDGDKWMPTDETLRAASPCFLGDTLMEALAEDRLYIAQYDWLADAPDAADGGRFVHVPKALFAVRKFSSQEHLTPTPKLSRLLTQISTHFALFVYLIAAANVDARKQTPLIPVAIWIYRAGAPLSDAHMYSPHDGYSWQIAKRTFFYQLSGSDSHVCNILIEQLTGPLQYLDCSM